MGSVSRSNKDAAPGAYRGVLTLTGLPGGCRFEVERPFTVRVYPPVIDTTSLWVTNWYSLFWRDDPFAETTGIIVESGNVLPGGDAWIVYPGYRTLLSSIRLEAMRDGLVDYELLKRLEQTHPDEAKELARQVVYRFDLYDMNVEAFRDKRRCTVSPLRRQYLHRPRVGHGGGRSGDLQPCGPQRSAVDACSRGHRQAQNQRALL